MSLGAKCLALAALAVMTLFVTAADDDVWWSGLGFGHSYVNVEYVMGCGPDGQNPPWGCHDKNGYLFAETQSYMSDQTDSTAVYAWLSLERAWQPCVGNSYSDKGGEIAFVEVSLPCYNPDDATVTAEATVEHTIFFEYEIDIGQTQVSDSY